MAQQQADTEFARNLATLIQKAGARARALKEDVLVSVTEEYDSMEPLQFFAGANELASERWYWERASDGFAVAGVGLLTGTTPPRRSRFTEADRSFRTTIQHAILATDSNDADSTPVFFAAFSFDPSYPQDRLVWQGFPSTFLLVPRMTLVRKHDRYLLTTNALVGPNLDPAKIEESATSFRDALLQASSSTDPRANVPVEILPNPKEERETNAFLSAINRTITAIQSDGLETVLTTRRRKVELARKLDAPLALNGLRTAYPDSCVFAATRHGSTFVGCSPSSLIEVNDRKVKATCVAGSIRRGNTDELDSALARQLTNDDLTQEWHEASVEALTADLEHGCSNINVPTLPDRRSNSSEHYLTTSIDAYLKDDASLLSVVGAVHPTSTATGTPKETALKAVREHEGIDRGWHSSPFGWIDSNGNGEFATSVRSAVIRAPVLDQHPLYLLTSRPVTNGTDPEQTLREADTDLAPFLAALTGASTDDQEPCPPGNQ